MIFGNLPIEEAEGAILGYAIAAGAHSFRKGTLLTSEHLAILKQQGITHIHAARLENGDIFENEAAFAIGQMLISENVEAGKAVTGRINLFARHDGLFQVRPSIIDMINLLDPRISIATLRNNLRVDRGQMIATVKIIPFAIPETLIKKLHDTQNTAETIDVKAFKATRIGLIQSRMPAIRESVLEKTKELISSRPTAITVPSALNFALNMNRPHCHNQSSK
ncbi:hypothetical protein ACFQ3K_07915 [Brucella gallinifaecis]|uniref:hypothetical protein n=1 Tax=Brucella gallinifaecis TaxID=215590 RepID=UPI001F1755FC|nr:hypothetical protein [Brucella gallinifaecis]